MWEEFGFLQNPYDHLPIAANAAGERLLVGRQEEIEKLKMRIKGRNAIPTLEGEIGVGKTSIISVAAYQLERDFFAHGGPCYLALEKPFQLDSTDSVETFSARVYQSVLLKLHDRRQDLVAAGINVGETRKLHSWLTSEQYTGVSATVGPVGGAGLNPTPNTSSGFSSLGFQNGVNLLLKGMFPNPKKGGVICVIDNLELLDKSASAREMIEAMRDKLLTAHGLIWVVCGARGIVRGVASSPRLQAHLSKPIEVNAIRKESIGDLIERRVQEYRVRPGEEKTPVGQDGFLHIFRICKDNLRTSLKFCAEFSEWLFENKQTHLSSEEKYKLLEVWLSAETDSFLQSVNLTPKPWEIFDKIVDMGGAVSPSDHQRFGYDTPMAMRPQIKSLEDAGLVESAIDETDQRRRTISLTPKGWLVNHSRRGYPE